MENNFDKELLLRLCDVVSCWVSESGNFLSTKDRLKMIKIAESEELYRNYKGQELDGFLKENGHE